MSTPQSGSPQDKNATIFESSDSPLLIFDGPWDATIRPRRPNSPRYFPGRTPPEEKPPTAPPPAQPEQT